VETNLKWPNDLHNLNGDKVGGILLHNGKKLVVGVGLNWAGRHQQYRSLFPDHTLQKNEFHTISAQIFQFILDHRMKSSEIITNWNNNCSHLNKSVQITDNEINISGTFVGIGPNGEAIIEKEQQRQNVYTGSLFITE
jgi:BirA family biotin operon repressor/biotin-[acetyl-CoA-carboxylase] ligase